MLGFQTPIEFAVRSVSTVHHLLQPQDASPELCQLALHPASVTSDLVRLQYFLQQLVRLLFLPCQIRALDRPHKQRKVGDIFHEKREDSSGLSGQFVLRERQALCNLLIGRVQLPLKSLLDDPDRLVSYGLWKEEVTAYKLTSKYVR